MFGVTSPSTISSTPQDTNKDEDGGKAENKGDNETRNETHLPPPPIKGPDHHGHHYCCPVSGNDHIHHCNCLSCLLQEKPGKEGTEILSR